LSEGAGYTVVIEDTAARAIRKLSADLQRRIMAKISSLGVNPRPSGSTKLTGKGNLYRVRVGDYRIVYEIRDDGKVVIVVIVGHRREVYRDM
jgi:mRNA interferase RelE/StbE